MTKIIYTCCCILALLCVTAAAQAETDTLVGTWRQYVNGRVLGDCSVKTNRVSGQYEMFLLDSNGNVETIGKGITNVQYDGTTWSFDSDAGSSVVKFVLKKVDDNTFEGTADGVRNNRWVRQTPVPAAAEQAAIDKFLVNNSSFRGDVKAVDGTGRTLLHLAAHVGDLATVKYLVSQGADVNAQADFDATPLHWATQNGHVEIIKYLVSEGADVNAEVGNGKTPLHIVAEQGQVEIAKYLVSQGANVNAKTSDIGSIPLHPAAVFGHVEVVKYLVSQGADINAKDNEDKTPLDWARGQNQPAVVAYLSGPAKIDTFLAFLEIALEIDEADIKAAVRDMNVQLLHMAATGRWDAAVVEYIVAQGADVNAKNEDGDTPLHYAAYFGNAEAVIYLVSQRANVNAKNNVGFTPLDEAKMGERPMVIAYLESIGATASANWPAVSAAQFTAAEQAEIDRFLAGREDFGGDVRAVRGELRVQMLHIAGNAQWDVAVARYLVAQGADINAKNNDGDTPLHYAAYNGNLEVVKYLVAQGADVHVKNNAGETPLDDAKSQNQTAVVRYLESVGARSGTSSQPPAQAPQSSPPVFRWNP